MIGKNYKEIALVLTAVVLFLLVSCDPSKKFEKEEATEIKNYLNANSTLNFVLQPSGLYYLEVVAGTGISPVTNDSVFVKYTGKFLDGTIFESNASSATAYGFIVGTRIEGFDEGVTLMKVGGKSTLLIPSKLAYGSYGTTTANSYIGGYTPLLFDIQLVKVVPYTGK